MHARVALERSRRRRPRSGRLVGILLLALLPVGCARQPSGPNVIVVVIDTLRSDRLGSYGNPNGLTPFLDELATRGVRFANAYAASSWTSPSVASLFTSRYPLQHRIADFDSKLDDSEVTLAERLQSAGWETFGITANFRLLPRLGFAQGFDGWRFWAFDRNVDAGFLRRRLLEWLDRPRRRMTRWVRPRPSFLYIHCMEPHGPYTPPARYRRGVGASASEADRRRVNDKLTGLHFDDLDLGEVTLLESLYDGAVAALDARLRRLFGSLEAQGLLRRAFVVVTADHGEEFRDHGLMGHGYQLYEESIRVPLLVLGPGVSAGRVVEEPVSLVDVAPTLLALLGIPPEPRFEGRSLVPIVGGQANGAPMDVLAELPDPRNGSARLRHRAALVRGHTKLVVRRTPDPPGVSSEVYDLAHDPRETRPNPPELAAEAPALAEALANRRTVLARRSAAASHGVVDDETRDRLRALGYAD